MKHIVEHVPAATRANFAAVEPGGTGRFDLVVKLPDGSSLLVRPTLSRWQAEQARDAVNTALEAWISAGLVTVAAPPVYRGIEHEETRP